VLTPKEAYAEARTLVDLIRSEAAHASISVHRLRGGVSVLEGSGGNIAVAAGTSGKLMIDAGITASKQKIKEAMAGLGPAPVTHLINTHWHFDHADGNEWLNGEGAAIIAHERTREHLAAVQRVEDWDFEFPPASAAAVPSRVVSGDGTVELNGYKLALRHHPGAHTDGDLTVTFVEADILHTGDIYWNGAYPFIDYSTGGNINGTIAAVEAILAMATESTIIVPGHGWPVSKRSELIAYRDMLVAVRDRVSAMKRRKMSLEEVVAAAPTAAYDAVWGQFVVKPALFTKLVYQGV
jgi:glyoxylase-like metal-dependent hydrolase (beta-lactamase superfamily II)